MCGIVGVFNYKDAAIVALDALQQLQHRGEEACGVAVYDDKERKIIDKKGVGLISNAAKLFDLTNLKGKIAIAHNRYSTSGDSGKKNAQPITVKCKYGSISVVHNGTLTNAGFLNSKFSECGSIFQTDTDTEMILFLFAKNHESDVTKNIITTLKQIEGAFSLLFLTPNQLIAARDPRGFRPLFMGKISGGYIFASESCALEYLDAKLVRELAPGEIVILRMDEGKVHKEIQFLQNEEKNFCIFEFIYFAKPDSTFDNLTVYNIRRKLGEQLAKEHPVYVDTVMPVPDSGTPFALGYAEASRIRFDMGLIKNHYIGRTFIKPDQKSREESVKAKLSPIIEVISGKRVGVIDDSLVRGTTFFKVVKMLRDAGAKEIHVLIASPPVKEACYYGIDTPNRQELIASERDIEETRKYIKADYLGYLSLEGLRKTIGETGYCDACFSGNYPVNRKLSESETVVRT